MEVPAPSINRFFKKTHKSKYNKIMHYYFKWLRIIFLLDFGFCELKSYKLNHLWKAITVLQAFSFCIVCTHIILYEKDVAILGEIMINLTIFSYFLGVLALLMLNPKKSLYSLFCDLESIDAILQADKEFFNFELYLLVVNFSKIGLKTLNYVYLGINHQRFSLFVILYWGVTSIDVFTINYLFGFYILSWRINKLLLILHTTKAKNSDFKLLLSTYKMIIELAAKFKSGVDFLFIISLVHNVSQLMFHILVAVQDNGENTSGKSMPAKPLPIATYYIVIESLLMIIFAPVAIEKNIIGVEKIKIVLHNKLMETIDFSKQQEINRFIEYVEAHDLRFRVYQVVPLDASLPGRVVSFCATYLIVIVQFTYK